MVERKEKEPTLEELKEKVRQIKPHDIKTLWAIDDFLNENDWMPTFRELFEPLNVNSTSVVANRINRLESLYLIKRDSKKNRMAFTPFGQFVLIISRDKELLDLLGRENDTQNSS